MASRFTTFKPVQRCLSPVRVFRDGHFSYFGCGRCPACRLDKANSWSLRLANEIETIPFSIFFTLTYSNKYLPVLQYIGIDDGIDSFGYYTPNNPFNVRFDSVKDVLRKEDFDKLAFNVNPLPIKNYKPTPFGEFDGVVPCSGAFISYSSKRDIQLWLKSIRQDIYETFNLENKDETERKSYSIRYYIVSEYGPLTRRAHCHGILFSYRPDVASYLLELSMFKNWQMCDYALFKEHTHYCDSGAAQYVTQYLTCSDNIPKILKDKSIRPFRLSSKSPSVGFSSFDKAQIYEDLFVGINQYCKVVARCETKYIFPYPSDFMHRLFPKCREYRLLPYARLRQIYGLLFWLASGGKFTYDYCSCFLREALFPADYEASRAYYKAAKEAEVKGEFLDVDSYLYLLDMYYYKESMFALSKFYEWQELHSNDSVSIMFSYTNFEEYVTRSRNFPIMQNTLAFFLYGFGLTLADMSPHNYGLLVTHFSSDTAFRAEVNDILAQMVKMPKFNEQFGFSPTNYV